MRTFTLKILSILIFSFLVRINAQSPNLISYQAVVRNAANVLTVNKAVGVKVSVLQTSASGTVVYQESFTPNPTTNANGLLTLQIGSGTPIVGTLAGIDWSAGPYFVKTEIDPNGGTTYSLTSISQLLSVPYALSAKMAQSVSGIAGTVNKVAKFSPLGTQLGDSQIFDDGNAVGVGTTTPIYKLDVQHGGSTGIRSKSTNSFSLVDIDAANGDAALRFINNGTNQWNVRNQPGTDSFQIYELGGSGQRFLIENGTGNVAIGSNIPIYRLDVEHGGGAGMRNKSTASYSVLDIDAFNGDAAIRFANNGVNQWNIRNQPGTDDLQIFELQGGGQRLLVQNATGNVGIGSIASPSYKLDVEHGGGTGMRNKSTASYSVLDIDAFNGDAAIRFANNGTNQWNIRNNPANDNFQVYELGGAGERLMVENNTGNVGINMSTPTARLHVGGDLTATGTKAFTIDHPLDPENKILRHFSIESNEVLNLYSGNVKTDTNGKATVKLPDYFDAINKDFRYQLTVIGTFAQAIISKKIANNQFEINTNQPNVEVSWEVKGVRNDLYMQNVNTMKAEEAKPANMVGKYIEPKAYNLPESRGVNYNQIKADDSVSAKINAPTNSKSGANSGGSIEQIKSKPVQNKAKVTDKESVD